MFEVAELGQRLSDKDAAERIQGLRERLLALQVRLKSADFPVVVVFAGVNGAGKSEMINLLNAWMDPRWLDTRAYGQPSEESRQRPAFWRYWRDLPAKGRMGLFLGSWYSQPIVDRVYGRLTQADYEEHLMQIARFEKTLADDGALVLKFWMHLDRKAQKKRMKALEADPVTSWRVTASDWENYQHYDAFVQAAEAALHRTGTAQTPWMIVEGADSNYRAVTVGEALADALEKHLDLQERLKEQGEHRFLPSTTRTLQPQVSTEAAVSLLDGVDLTLRLGGDAYERKLACWQGRLGAAVSQAAALGMTTVVVFEGWDAAGKGSAIRRITGALDARQYVVHPIAAPSDEELAHHYLWRFWRRLPRAGRVCIFDRSWYGRVLVERVESLTPEPVWMRAYAELSDFEEQMVAAGVLVVKFWLQISPEEQLRRFEARAQVPWKQFKLTDEDWRNRDRRVLYEQAVADMVERTSTQFAPWTLVAAEDKRFARIQVLKTLVQRMEAAILARQKAAPAGKKGKSDD